MPRRANRKPSSSAAPSLTPRDALERAGGVAGANWIAAWLSRRLGQPVRPRQVRDRLKHCGDGVIRLGAGYYALSAQASLSVDVWATRWLALRPAPMPVEDLVQAVLDAYPHGDPVAVRAWVHQEPGALRVRDGAVWLVSQLPPG